MNEKIILSILCILAAIYVIKKGVTLMRYTSPSWLNKSKISKYYLQDYKMLSKYHGLGYIIAAAGLVILLIHLLTHVWYLLILGVILIATGYILSTWAGKAIN